jgi:hypothetical protein
MVGIFGAGMSTIRLGWRASFINNYHRTGGGDARYVRRCRHLADYQTVAGRKGEIGVLSVGVPGSLKGGRKPFRAMARSRSNVLQPAIHIRARHRSTRVRDHPQVRRRHRPCSGTAKTRLPERGTLGRRVGRTEMRRP